MAQTNAQASLPSMSRWRPEHLAAVVRVSQGLVQVRVVKHLPEPIYGLPISLRMVGSHPLDCSQCKREECVAAALQGRSYRLRVDEFAESQHSRGIGKIMRRGRFWLRRFCANLMASTIMRSELEQKPADHSSVPIRLVFKTFGFNITQSFPTKFRFSILQRVDPDMETNNVFALETTWKKRLHTHWPEGLNDN